MLMVFSATSKMFMLHSTAAYSKFEKHQIPFTAVKILLSGSKSKRHQFDHVVGNNFRSERDIILKSENYYAVLLQNTSLEAAEEAMNRLGAKLNRLTGNTGQQVKREVPLVASACLYGTCQDAGKLDFKFLDLTTVICDRKKSENMLSSLRAYSKWMEPEENKEYKSVSVLV